MKGENKGFEILGYIVLGIFAVACILPFLLLISGSITDEITITAKGYSFIPAKVGFSAYQYIFSHMSTFVRSTLISLGITAVGTIIHTALAATMAYPLSKQDMPGRTAVSFLIIVTILLNGGLVPTYLVYTQFLHIKNTLWALLIPTLLLNGYNIILLRNFFSQSIPASMLEAARIDGSGEIHTFNTIVLPLLKPAMATQAIFGFVASWNNLYTPSIILATERKKQTMPMYVQALKANDKSRDWGQIYCGLFTTVLPILVMYFFLSKYIIAGVALGGVKE